MTCPRCGCVFCPDDCSGEGADPQVYCTPQCRKRAQNRLWRQRRGQSRHQQVERSLRACAEQKKPQYPDKPAAEAAGRAMRVDRPLYAYLCPGADHWHLTSKPRYGRQRAAAIPVGRVDNA